MKKHLKDVHSITLQHDSFEREVREMILSLFEDRTLPGGSHQLDVMTKIVKASYFAGQQSLLDDINEDGPEDAPKLVMCRCGNATCTTVQFSNFGRFYNGAGFTIREAMRIRGAWLRNKVEEERVVITGTFDIETYFPDYFEADTPWVATFEGDNGVEVVGKGRGKMSAAKFRALYEQERPADKNPNTTSFVMTDEGERPVTIEERMREGLELPSDRPLYEARNWAGGPYKAGESYTGKTVTPADIKEVGLTGRTGHIIIFDELEYPDAQNLSDDIDE